MILKLLNAYPNQSSIHFNERALLGIGVSFQRPPAIKGLKTREIVEICDVNRSADIDELTKKLNFIEL